MKYLILIFFLILSCSPSIQSEEDFEYHPPSQFDDPNHFHIVIDSSFPTDRQILIKESARAWPLNNLSFEIADPSLPQYTFFVKVFNQDPSFSGYAGWTERTGHASFIQIKPNLEPQMFRAVMSHEFGHAFFLSHYTGPNPSIMHPEVQEDDVVSCQDFISFCLIWNCHIDCSISPISIKEDK